VDDSVIVIVIVVSVTVVDRNLETCVEELRAAVVSGKSQVVLADVEAMVLALGHIGRSLASLRGNFVIENSVKLTKTYRDQKAIPT